MHDNTVSQIPLPLLLTGFYKTRFILKKYTSCWVGKFSWNCL